MIHFKRDHGCGYRKVHLDAFARLGRKRFTSLSLRGLELEQACAAMEHS